MLFKIFVTGLFCFSGIGFAVDDNAQPVDQVLNAVQPPEGEPDGVKGTSYLNSWVIIQEGGLYGSSIPGNIYVERVDFARTGTYQDLRANVWIPYCSGGFGPCRRAFSFALHCRDDWGNTTVIHSPYFRNEATNGYEYRNYSFYQQQITWCSYVDQIQMNWRYGW